MRSTLSSLVAAAPLVLQVIAINVPPSPPASAVLVDPAVLSVSLEFFTFPDYTTINATNNCLANIESLRGTFPAIRIGGTTQDRATYDPTLATAVNYTVASPLDAPLNLTYGPSFFSLAAQMKGDVTVGLNRQLNNMSNSLSAALQAEKTMENLLSIEFGNEPDLYSQSSPIVPAGSTWSPPVDGAVQKQWISSMASSLGGIFQAAVYLSYPKWSTQGLIPILNTTVEYVKTFSGHSYPQSACGGATTNLPALMNHSAIVSYTSQYKPEASAAHGVGKRYFLGETNSATCGGGGISPTFGAALWVMDYVLQGALNGVDRLYFHQGTIGNCQYCFWGRTTVEAPYYGAAFVSEFLGTGGVKLAMLDDGSGAVGSYAVYSQDTNRPVRLLVYNSNYYNGTGTRTVSTITFTGISGGQTGSVIVAKRLTASNANVTIDAGGEVTIGGGGMFDENCLPTGVQSLEGVSVGSGGTISVSVNASEALIVYL